ncbi:MAG TPA: alpha-L-fucosidase [Desulfuromonadaceae bacterium]|nr:alpha-L-fucosidase [Desulfuromonadaceae bacterium]
MTFHFPAHQWRRLCVLLLAISITAGPAAPDTTWFRDAKFGIFMHWGLYSQLGNEWQGKSHYGSGEWLMHVAKIPAADYARVANDFNPTNFNAGDWARFVKDSGARYLVVTAKHHEGFAMFGSKASPFNIVDATPYHQDPMKPLADACRGEGVKFGFYYSQFLDWHEPNGGGNTWDFNPSNKNYQAYYQQKSIPQIKELLSNYGSLGLVWFDMPGGLTRDETLAFMENVRQLQPDCLVSSRVGNGLGDFRDLGDSELSTMPIAPPWEALFTHNDSWGYIGSDNNFKTPQELIHLLASVSARGGNLILNVGPDGTGKIPETSQRYLREVGKWLATNGDSIYGTAASPIPDQPWGVSTLKSNRLYLHIFRRPKDGVVCVPGFDATFQRAVVLPTKETLKATQADGGLQISLPEMLADERDTVVACDFDGTLSGGWTNLPSVVSRQFDSFSIDAAKGRVAGNAIIKSATSSQYFGNWKHDACAQAMQTPDDRIEYSVRFLEPGDYRIALDYFCPRTSAGREGVVEIAGQSLLFETLATGTYDTHQPLIFFHHSAGIVHVTTAGVLPLSVHPRAAGVELFWLRRLVVEPVH